MSNDIFETIVHYNGQMVKNDVGILFEYESTTKMRFEKEIIIQKKKEKISQKIVKEIHSLRYRWLTCENPFRYCAINLQDDADVQIMIAEHEPMEIQYIELFAEVYDVPVHPETSLENLVK
ncbi:hypothetical protein GQ457_03G019920 [Hibiscus cannabinus]